MDKIAKISSQESTDHIKNKLDNFNIEFIDLSNSTEVYMNDIFIYQCQYTSEKDLKIINVINTLEIHLFNKVIFISKYKFNLHK
jgi:hypothetical protein